MSKLDYKDTSKSRTNCWLLSLRHSPSGHVPMWHTTHSHRPHLCAHYFLFWQSSGSLLFVWCSYYGYQPIVSLCI